uniref:FAM171 C-terminal domain-containing protein n=1 Tax=Ornithorhynchus anatinus TaxID=9258 RepID=A0A6I8P045_ORNAN
MVPRALAPSSLLPRSSARECPAPPPPPTPLLRKSQRSVPVRRLAGGRERFRRGQSGEGRGVEGHARKGRVAKPRRPLGTGGLPRTSRSEIRLDVGRGPGFRASAVLAFTTAGVWIFRGPGVRRPSPEEVPCNVPASRVCLPAPRRKCLKPRRHPRKPQLSASLDASKKDQSTSMSHVNLLFCHRESDFPGALAVATGGCPDLSGREEGAGPETISAAGDPGPPGPRLKLSYSTSQEFSSREELLSRGDEDRSGVSFDNLTPGGAFGKDYRGSVEIFPPRSRRAPEAGGREDGYRKGYGVPVPPPGRGAQAPVRPLPAGGRRRIATRPGPGPPSPERERPADRRPAECAMSRSVDHLERPAPAFPRPGQLLCCNSVDQVSDRLYRGAGPALAVPARYLKLPGEPPYGGGRPWGAPAEEPGEMERLRAELAGSLAQPFPPPFSAQAVSQQHLQEAGAGDWSAPDAPMAESLSIPAALNDAALVHVAAGDGQLLVEKALMELGGGEPPPHPRAWFVSLDGRSNAHVRHSYIDLQRAGRGGRNDASLDSGVDMNEPGSARKGRGEPPPLPPPNAQGGREPPPGEPPGPDGPASPRLLDLDEPDREGGEGPASPCAPEDGAPRCFPEAAGRRAGAQLPSLREETAKRAADRGPEPPAESPPSPAGPDPAPAALGAEGDDDDDDDQGEDKKSPWQRREERPLMAFNLK